MISPSTRRAEKAAASLRSCSASSSELPASVLTPRARATSSTPRWTAEKNGLPTSSTTSPMLAEPPVALRSVLATSSRRKPSSCDGVEHASDAFRPHGAVPLRTRDTVLTLTPAREATSFIVGRRAPPAGGVIPRTIAHA